MLHRERKRLFLSKCAATTHLRAESLVLYYDIHQINRLSLRQLSMASCFGIVYAGDRAANLANSVILPAYSRWDAGVYYNRGRLTSSLYLENVFDVAYAASSIRGKTSYLV